MNDNNAIKIDTDNINNTIGDIDSKLKELEEKILDGKTKEEQEKIKKEWEEKKIKFENELSKNQEEFNKRKEEWEEKQSELISTVEVKSGLNEIMDNLDRDWNETLKSTIEDLCKGKTEEEKAKIMKAFENGFMK